MAEAGLPSSKPEPPTSHEEAIFPTADNQPKSETANTTKKKRNLPGMPDPDAEVIALSPKTLLATNRFVCEICNKGFQRDQNLQLHRRGHNLPWKLRQRTGKEVRKRVFVCPEPTCVHHDRSRALGDLTGVKKHFCRKHGDKKFKCERCSKNYAVQSDWKAHMKTCGTREYRCDCGTLFWRRDSFITHRAFCDALAQESSVRPRPLMAAPSSDADLKVEAVAIVGSPPPQPPTPSTGVLSPVLSIQSSVETPENQTGNILSALGSGALSTSVATTITTTPAATAPCHVSDSSASTINFHENIRVFATPFNAAHAIDPISLSLSSFYGTSSLFPVSSQNPHPSYTTNVQPALSATALLQKAAQMGATSSNSSFLRGLGLAVPSSSDPRDNISSTSSMVPLWSNGVKLESDLHASGLELGLPFANGSSGFNELTMSPSGLFGNKPTTLDFLGL